MAGRKLWLVVDKGVTINEGKLRFDVHGKSNERIGALTITDTCMKWRPKSARKGTEYKVYWEQLTEVIENGQGKAEG